MRLFKTYKPFRPFAVTQNWNNKNSMYRDAGFSFTRHNGVDAHIGVPKNYPVWCPMGNSIVHMVRYVEKGGGHEMWLRSKEKMQIGDKVCYAYLVMAHADKILVPEGYEPELGELLMVADNTGFSTGIHTHIGLYRIDYDEHSKNITWLDSNDANGSFDPMLYMQYEYALDKSSSKTLLTKSIPRYIKYLATK